LRSILCCKDDGTLFAVVVEGEGDPWVGNACLPKRDSGFGGDDGAPKGWRCGRWLWSGEDL